MFTSKPRLFSHKISIRLPCGAVLNGGTQDDLSLVRHSDDWNLLHLTAAPVSRQQCTCAVPLCRLKVLLGIIQISRSIATFSSRKNMAMQYAER